MRRYALRFARLYLTVPHNAIARSVRVMFLKLTSVAYAIFDPCSVDAHVVAVVFAVFEQELMPMLHLQDGR